MNSPDGDFDLMNLDRIQREAVSTLIIGPTPGSNRSENSIRLNQEQLSNLMGIELYLPNLSSLHLWGIENLLTINGLPNSLTVLDIRSCPEFLELDKIRGKLEMLIIEDAPEFKSCGLPEKYAKLWDVSLQGTGISSEFLNELLSKTPALQRLHLNRCVKLKAIQDWHFPKNQLEDIRLSECPKLASLPDEWPALRRLDLRNSPKARSEFSRRKLRHEKLQYLDLTGAKQIDSFPIDESCFSGTNQLQTLYLYRSGIQEPPKSLHGSKDDQNVLEDIAGYYQDARIVGTGQIDRSKILMLGNGGVGKTCLSLALHPNDVYPDPAEKAEELKTTHAIQFFSLKRMTNDPYFPELNLSIWDFGGQEIYHGTHRLFVQTGAVFCVLWHPEENCREEDRNNPDENRPLQYWLDYIRLARSNGRDPKVAIVVPRSAERDLSLIRSIRRKAGKDNLSLIEKSNKNIFFIESGTRGGEFERFNEWLESSVVETLKTEGTNYPSHWAMAESMVTGWQKDPSIKLMSIHAFKERLENYIQQQLQTRGDTFRKLNDAWRAPQDSFRLNKNQRLERTLKFLTDIGLLYWIPGLLGSSGDSQVIINQKWALNAIYAIVDHRKSAKRWHDFMSLNGGIFSIDDLNEKGWKTKNQNYTDEEKETILRLMVECDICFRIVDKEDSWFEKDIYACFSWLPEFKKRHQWLNDVDGQDGKLEPDSDLQNVRMLRHHWYSFLAAAGRQYGHNAEYAKDAFKLTLLERDKEDGMPKPGPSILIHFKLDSDSGIKGSFDIYATGKKSSHTQVKHAITLLKSFLPNQPKAKKELEEYQHREKPPVVEGRPDSAEAATALVRGNDVQGPDALPRKTTVFISYSWGGRQAKDPENEHTTPVKYIRDLLSMSNDFLVSMDRTDIERNENIQDKLLILTKNDRIITVTCTEYFKSEYCIWELIKTYEQFKVSPKNILNSVVVVVLIEDQDYFRGTNKKSLRKEISEYWENYSKEFLETFYADPGQTTMLQVEIHKDDRKTVNAFIKNIEEHNKKLVYWDKNNPDKSITEIRNELTAYHSEHPSA